MGQLGQSQLGHDQLGQTVVKTLEASVGTSTSTVHSATVYRSFGDTFALYTRGDKFHGGTVE